MYTQPEAIFNMLSDIAMLSVPIYLIWRLQISRRRKIGISAIFLTGGLYVAALSQPPPLKSILTYLLGHASPASSA